MNYDKYEIIRDTREKHGWDFESFDKCKGVIQEGSKTGDYTIKGLESVVCIERKASTREISMNLGKERSRFLAEMERMSEFRWAYIVCEFSINDLMTFPKNSGIPQRRWKYTKMNGKFMWKQLCEFKENYNVETLFCGNRIKAEEKTADIFEEITERLDYEGQQ